MRTDAFCQRWHSRVGLLAAAFFSAQARICAGCASGFHLIDAAFGGLQQRLGPGYDATKCIRPEIIETDIRRAYAPQICPGDS